ncbi:MAG TPA: biotin carboxylase N-terminal domain-containing protein [Candidatus Binataceae bacterium]|nr:biotin carboxylase N-terminal domain-containing protein [Candidatus Binataceae bacterium]
MIRSLLIANRGEIACRIIRTCRRLGVRTIAVFSDADANALHVAMADECRCIGAAEASASYLNADAIVKAALAVGAEAIHPGYGFLAEKTILPELCAKHGLIWVGPSAACIEAMGSKVESRRLARDADVACVPGYDGDSQEPRRLLDEAKAIGFPVVIKASAGGGGKGMRRVDDSAGFPRALELAKREALAAFGSDQMLIEKFIARPRHIEVQLAGDKHGNLIHLFERECSIQRNYQKVVEEAPAAYLDSAIREKLFDAALRLGRAIGYDSLGTVEFLVDAEGGGPWFLEMNTRLQVEHPVTEMITGLDLVEMQLRIASGEKLAMTQHQVRAHGAAIEVRLNAEDPSREYQPCVGRIEVYREPDGEGVRVDSGIRSGSEVTPYYDSMLAKVIARGSDRAGAVQRLCAALERFVILGIGTNQMFLRDLVSHPAFTAKPLTTGYIGEIFPGGWKRPEPEEWRYASAAAALMFDHPRDNAPNALNNPWLTLAGFRVIGRAGRPGRTKFSIELTGAPSKIATLSPSADGFAVELEGSRQSVVIRSSPDGKLLIAHDDLADEALCHVADDKVSILCRGQADDFTVQPLAEALAASTKSDHASGSDVRSAMPGRINSVEVSIGQNVNRGDIVIVMEAMKLILSLTAPADGTVTAIHCAAGQTVAGGIRLVEIAAAAAETHAKSAATS